MRFQQQPSPLVMGLGNGIDAPAGVITCKRSRHSKDEEVGLVILGNAGLCSETDDRTVGGVKTGAAAGPLFQVFIPLRLIRAGTVECCSLQQREDSVCLSHYAHFIAILEVLSHAG